MNNNNNNSSTQKRTLCNPRATAPAIFIPCWLIQISVKLLSHGAKLCYGRLSQWANSKGTVYRSCSQLAEELGVSVRSIEEYLKELRDKELIGTFQTESGGINHYEFYDHPWMHEPINEHLSYNEIPPTGSCGTPHTIPWYPPQDSVEINKRNKSNNNKYINNKGVSDETVLIEDNLDDFFTNKKPKPKKPRPSFQEILTYIFARNTFGIEEKLIEDWVKARSKKRADVTESVWTGIIRQLEKCSFEGLNVHACFEEMVVRGWSSVKPEWCKTINPTYQKSHREPQWSVDKVLRA